MRIKRNPYNIFDFDHVEEILMECSSEEFKFLHRALMEYTILSKLVDEDSKDFKLGQRMIEAFRPENWIQEKKNGQSVAKILDGTIQKMKEEDW